MTKRKDERKELLKEDEFLSFLQRVARYIQENPQNTVLMAIAGLILLAVLFGGLSFQKKAGLEKAAILYQAEQILDTDLNDENAKLKFASEKEKYEAALEKCDELIQAQSGIIQQQATVYKIHCLISLGRHDQLEALYQSLVDKDYGFKMFGHMGLADKYRSEKNYSNALAHYNELLLAKGSAPSLKELAKFKMAQTQKESGDLASAKETLSELIAKFEKVEQSEQPPILAQAKQLLTELEEDASTSQADAS